MRIFECSSCNHAVFFENVRCVHCSAVLAYDFDQGEMLSLEATDPADAESAYVVYRDLGGSDTTYKLCANSEQYGVCNAALRTDSPDTLCEACRLNTVIPDLSVDRATDGWRAIEIAKRRLLYTLKSLQLPVDSDLPIKLTFSFMKDSPDGSTKVLTGHDEGHITLNVAEADAPFREKLRVELGEGYRTLLGHFRHEIGHFYWDALVKDSVWLAACRQLFGDEQIDYGEALKHHYENGPPANWHERFVSAYATMHPWEDWAETWAHYLHIVDTLDTARSYRLSISAEVSKDVGTLSAKSSKVRPDHFPDLLGAWVPLTVTLNSLNRSMGLNDPYPFVLSETIARKLQFVHDVIHSVHLAAEDRAAVAARWEAHDTTPGQEEKLLPGNRKVSEQQREAPVASQRDGDGVEAGETLGGAAPQESAPSAQTAAPAAPL